ncbi:hypothetical protein B0J17DRAFT_716110 [Rhizoctonia solani]|nr:hypothetical protein B0J17DRAFT_716110 [Rhizoctonia solani]
MGQLVLSETVLAIPKSQWSHTLLIPAACALVSIVLLLVHVALAATPTRRYIAKFRGREICESDSSPQQPAVRQRAGFFPDLQSHIKGHGGLTIFTWKVLRLLSCLALTGLTIAAIVFVNEGRETIGTKEHSLSGESDVGSDAYAIHTQWEKKHKKKRTQWFSTAEWIEISLCLFYTYTTLLAILAITLGHRFRHIVNKHLVVLLLAASVVYAWRDLIPPATYDLRQPTLLVCLHSPRLLFLYASQGYTYLSILNDTPNPEQTASLISLMLFSFLDPLIWAAYRAPKLEYDQLPHLADYDRASYLKQRSFDHLDPLRRTKRRYFFWGLMAVFRREYIIMTIMLVIKALMEFAGPVGIKYILQYLEDPSDPGFLRPWFWILWLFLGPVLGSIAMQWYIFVKMGSVVRAEGMITQLLFEHSLRIRMVAQVASGSGGKTPKAATPAVDAASIVETQGAPADVLTQLPEANEEESESTGHTAETSNSQTLIASTSSTKGRDSDASTGEDNSSSNLVGKINNLMSTDLENIVDGADIMFVLVFAPVQIIFSIFFLYRILGWSSVVGMIFLVISFPIPGKLAQLVNDVQTERMKKTDERIQAISESLNVIRMVKLFGWEKKVIAQVEEKRNIELYYYKKKQWIGQVSANANYILPLIVMAITFASHTLWFKKTLNASIVFSSVGVFDVLRNQLHMLSWQIPMSVQAKVSIDRIDEFLHKTELLDAYIEKQPPEILEPSPPAAGTIGFRNATLHIDEELLFRRGKINMVVGPTGCGKTSLLMALLGEMHFVPSSPDSWFSLPREGGIAYAAQEAWVQNETIRENILLGTEYDEERYKQVISQCALERDLTLFQAGDQTEVGEKGMTLSGGQKARVSLARAIYSKADTIILDDVLSALDVHTSRWIVDNCFRGDLVAGRTMIIVTHNVAMVSEVADFVVSLGTDGRIASQGSIDEAFRLNPKLKAEAEKDQEMERKGDQLMVAEEVAEGHVGWPALKLFLLALGGFWFWVVYLVGFTLADVAVLGQTYWLGTWARAYETDPEHPERVDVPFYLAIYGVFCIVGIGLYTIAFIVHVLGSVRAARRIHDRLIKAVLGAPLRWLDSTPIGRVIARFTQDIRCVDGSLPNEFQNLVDMTSSCSRGLSLSLCFREYLLRITSSTFLLQQSSPIFTIPGAAVFVIGFWIGQIYITAQLSVKREMSNAARLYSAISGLLSRRVDKYTRSGRTFYNLNRWICIRMDTLGGLFAAGLAAYMVYYRSSVDASDTGFSLNMAVAFSGGIIWWVRILNEFEVQGNSLERIQDYIKIEQEPEAVPEKVPPAYWPASGNIRVENLTARYSTDGPAVLHNLSFEIKSGERVGVVGRTGSGKSSLTLSLLRMIPIEGNVYYDGIPTHAVNLDVLRSNITIIPQQPELMSGTVRQNLDPFDEYDDAMLNAALRSAGLDQCSRRTMKAILGWTRILALARAIVRRSKVLILDEATAAIDYNTDTAIQKSIRTELNDRTLIIVAHRLQTICDADKIMVLEAGKIIEFDSPAALLHKESGAFKSLVDKSGDRDALYAMAKGH